MKFWGGTKGDLRKNDLPQPNWKDPDQALSEILSYCLEQAKDSERWYMRKRTPKRIASRILRVASIALVAVGVLIPILAQIYTEDGKPVIAPGWASLALVSAATMVALDRLFGFSTAWARFIDANFRIARLRHELEFEWQTLRAEAGGCGADPVLLMELAREFVREVDEVVAGEVHTWSNEFKASLDTAADGLKHHG